VYATEYQLPRSIKEVPPAGSPFPRAVPGIVTMHEGWRILLIYTGLLRLTINLTINKYRQTNRVIEEIAAIRGFEASHNRCLELRIFLKTLVRLLLPGFPNDGVKTAGISCEC